LRAQLSGFAVLFLLASPAMLPAQEGKLAAVREEVRKPEKEDKDLCCPPEVCDCAGDMLCELCRCCGKGYVEVVIESFCLPAYFPRFPYADGYSGYVRVDHELITLQPDLPALPPYFADTKLWSCQFSVEGGSDFDGLTRTGAHVLLDTSYHVGGCFNFNQYKEKLVGGKTDELFVGDANLFISLIRSRRLTDRCGIGLRFMTDERDTDYGVNILYGVDFFPAKPLVVSLAVDGGTLGDTGVIHFRGSMGLCFRHHEIWVGYDCLRIGDVNLQGPFWGWRLWF
jgi:hypothetical protein